MSTRLRLLGFALLVGGILALSALAQEQSSAPPPEIAPENMPMPAVPKGVEVLARGPIHEAFATPTTEPVPTKKVTKAPPKPLDELPPAEKPAGNVTWIGGYWAWDDDRQDYLWVSGIWRSPPPDKKWVPGYWKPDGEEHQWVPGFWTPEIAPSNAQNRLVQDQITYMPAPPARPETAPPGEAPNPESFYVPGHWEWHQAGYVVINGVQEYRPASYLWTSGYWAQIQPGYVWVPAHYVWTPSGYIYVAGYWDLAVARRGVVYAPVIVEPGLIVGGGFVYTPAYAVRDTVLIETLWVRPNYCHYYFGDYYGGVYVGFGFQSAFVFGRAHYDPLITYACYEHRGVPGWSGVQINLVFARNAGRAPLPPRTLVQQNITVNNINNVTVVNNKTIVNNKTVNNQMIASAHQVAAEKGTQTTSLDAHARNAARQQAQTIQQASLQRTQVEARAPAGNLSQPRQASLNVPSTQLVTSKGLQPAPVSVRPTTASTGTAAAGQHAATGPGGPGNASTNHGQPGANGQMPPRPGMPGSGTQAKTTGQPKLPVWPVKTQKDKQKQSSKEGSKGP